MYVAEIVVNNPLAPQGRAAVGQRLELAPALSGCPQDLAGDTEAVHRPTDKTGLGRGAKNYKAGASNDAPYNLLLFVVVFNDNS